MPDREKRPVTVEDLLKIKRSERPRDEFWNSWQAEMRTKLNAAKQERRPWWKDVFHRLGIGIARHQMAFGTTCMLALGFVLLHDSRPSFAPLPGELPGAELRVSKPAAQPVPTPILMGLEQTPGALVESESKVFSDAPQTREASRAITGMERAQGPSPAAMAIAANRAAVEAVDPDLSPRYSFGDVFEVPDRLAEPSVTETHHENNLGYSFVPSVAEESSTQSRRQDRLVSRLSEDALSEAQSRRLGSSRGDRVSLRF